MSDSESPELGFGDVLIGERQEDQVLRKKI